MGKRVQFINLTSGGKGMLPPPQELALFGPV